MFKKNLQGSKTSALIKEAFTLECFAESRFKVFASIARNEGLPAVAGVFSDLARSQANHALHHFNMLRDSGEPYYSFKTETTIDNLKTALDTELHESDANAAIIKIATDEGLDDIAERTKELAIAEVSNIHRLNEIEKTIM